MKLKRVLCINLIVQIHANPTTVTKCITYNSIQTERDIIHTS